MLQIPQFFLKHPCNAHLYILYRSHFGSRYTFGPMRSSQAFLGSIPSSPIILFSVLFFPIPSFVYGSGFTGCCSPSARAAPRVVPASLGYITLASGHTASNAPDLFRTPKLSGAGPGQYRGGGPPGKPLGCCWLFHFPLWACFRAYPHARAP